MSCQKRIILYNMQRWEANIANSQEKRTPSFKTYLFSEVQLFVIKWLFSKGSWCCRSRTWRRSRDRIPKQVL
jgi:hypothetical protein